MSGGKASEWLRNTLLTRRCYLPAMQPLFAFDVVPAHDLIRISMAGFFEAEDIIRFCQAMKLAHEKLACAPNQHRTLVDIRGMRIQSQETVAAFGKVLADPHYIAKQLAVVMTTNLVRKQIQRAAVERDARYFDDVEAAEHWLLATGSTSGCSDRLVGQVAGR